MAVTFNWKTRVGLVVSAVWLCLVLLVADDYRRISQFLAVGALPLIVIWGAIWAITGWRSQRSLKNGREEALLAVQRAQRMKRVQIGVSLFAVFAIGLFSANWQFQIANNEAGGNAIASWFGEWLVYGLVAYAIFRAVPKLPYGSPALLAALIIVGAVNWKSYVAISEERQAVASLARAAPLLNKIQAGTQITEKEVVAAQIGVLEPLVLAQAAYAREVGAATENYQQAIANLAIEQVLSPLSLASSETRFQTRAKLKTWQQVVSEYKSQIEASTARAKLGMQAALQQMPSNYSLSANSGFDEMAQQLSTYINGLVEIEVEASQSITAILDLLEANPKSYVLHKGPPPNLLFQDESILTQYRKHVSNVLELGSREQEHRVRLLQAQSKRAEKLGELLKN